MASITESGQRQKMTGESELLTQIIDEGRMAIHIGQRPNAAKLLQRFAGQAMTEKLVPHDQGLMTAIQKRIEQIDVQLTTGLNAVMHSEQFQQLESAWRGLHDLVQKTETGQRLKLRVLNLTKAELANDLKKAIAVDQSNLFKKVYEEEYGTFGGAPYSVLVGDYYMTRSPADIALLGQIAEVAAMAHAPFITGADAALFDMEQFTQLGVPRDMSKTFDSVEMAGWRDFRDHEDSRYVALTLPRYLMRLPYGEKTVKVENFGFEEGRDGMPHQRYLWGNSAYLLAQRITDAFAQHGWAAAIRGFEGGGAVGGLPTHTFKTGEGDTVMKCPTEVTITDRREKELNDLGFISVVHKKNENCAVFFGGQTVNKPIAYSNALATANARLSSQLPCILAASRFAHYIKVMMRDKIGSFATRENVEVYLNNWIAKYVLINDNASQAVKAQYPLRAARVDVFDVPGKPGCYKATVFLRPHFQLEELTASIRLVTDLPAPVTA